MEPSYYSWMMQGEFPLYTKKCLDKVWQRFRAKQKEQATAPRQERPQQQGRPQHPSRPKQKAGPITEDMLKNLQAKFGK